MGIARRRQYEIQPGRKMSEKSELSIFDFYEINNIFEARIMYLKM
jgi:hypothetical protein